jgi:hypothetical protein
VLTREYASPGHIKRCEEKKLHTVQQLLEEDFYQLNKTVEEILAKKPLLSKNPSVEKIKQMII